MELIDIQLKIHDVRGQWVMFDYDLACLYGSETTLLKETVRLNMAPFPEEFMFELTAQEAEFLHAPKEAPLFVFTELGISVLAGILNSEAAIGTSILIVKSFISLREMDLARKTSARKIVEMDERMAEYETQQAEIYDLLRRLVEEKKACYDWENRNPIGFRL